MADNYCKCKGCKHIDPNERSGYKWYCTWYRSYEDPDIVRECSRFEDQNGSSTCFLTSACCKHRGLPDDCAELTALRNFRDTYLMSNEEGRQLVEEYYRIAPGIVEKLDRHSDKDAMYEDIFSTIHSIVEMLERSEHGAAVVAYKEMVLAVQSKVN